MEYAHSIRADTVRRELGAILRRHRDESDRRLTDIAREAGCSPAYLSEVERGRKDVSTDLLIALVYALGVSIAGVFAELGDRLAPEDAPAVAHPTDPRRQLQLATAGLDAGSLRTIAQFSAFLAVHRTEPQRRRIGFMPS